MDDIFPNPEIQNDYDRAMDYTFRRCEWWCQNFVKHIDYQVYLTDDDLYDGCVSVRIGEVKAKVLTCEKDNKIAWWLDCVLQDAMEHEDKKADGYLHLID